MGNMSGSYGSHYTIWINIKTNSQSVSNNQTNITTELYLSFDGSTYWATQYNVTSGNMVVLWDGVEKVNQSYTIPQIVFSSGQKKDILLASWTGNVPHDSSGKRKVTVSGSWDTQTSRIGSGVSTITDYELKQINRYPNFTTNPYIVSKGLDSLTFSYGAVDMASSIYYSLDNFNWIPIYSQNTSINNLSPNTLYTIYVQARNQQDHSLSTTRSFQTSTLDIARMQSAPNINIGDSAYISWTNPSGATIGYFLEALYWDNSEHKITIRDVTYVTGQLSATINLTSEELQRLYEFTSKVNQCTLRYGIRTFYSNNQDSNWLDRIGTIVNANPIFSNFNYNENDSSITSLTGGSNIVKRYSDISVTVLSGNKAEAQKGASIQTYKVVIGNQSKTFNYSNNSDVSSEIMYNVNNNVIDVYAIDSRGNSTKVSKAIDLKNYFAPQIQFLSATRENGIGEKVTLDFTVNFWNENFGKVQNTLKSLVYKYKTIWSNEYINGSATLNYNINGNIVTGSVELSETFQLNDTYNIQLFVNDELNSSNVVVTISAGNPALAIYKNRLAIGGRYDENYDDPLQIFGKARFISENGHIFQVGQDEIYWKENEYGDKFKIIPNFSGVDDENKLKIMASVGGAGENPDLYDIFTISGKSGDTWIKGNLSIGGILNRDYTNTWMPVFNNGRLDYTMRKFGGSIQSTNYPTDSDCLTTLDFLSWWNGAYSTGGASNLTYCYQGIIQAKPDILYENADGTTGSVTLSNSCENYDLIEIIFGKDYKYFTSTRCIAVNNRVVSLVTGVHLNDTDKQILIRNVLFSGASVTNEGQGIVNFGINNIATYNNNEVKIYKILGYK